MEIHRYISHSNQVIVEGGKKKTKETLFHEQLVLGSTLKSTFSFSHTFVKLWASATLLSMFPFKVTSWVFSYSKVQKPLWSLHEGEEASEVTEGKKLSAWTFCVPLKGQCWRWKRSTLYQDHKVSTIFLLRLNMPAFEKFGPQKALTWINLPLVPSSPVWITNYKCRRHV